MGAYLKPKWEKELKPFAAPRGEKPVADTGHEGIDQTAKMYIGGKQARPDSGYSRAVLGPTGEIVGEVGDGNRKDIRNAVEAARAALGWANTTAHARAQSLYFLAENLEYRSDEFAQRLREQTGESRSPPPRRK